ncbi:glycosyltransferase family 2 protein [Roseococcus sp. SYP-B2431]|uniref:glycosyltransferase family 2 protein n=1 Tax=Roseococcus sp. SYP-B2431 TaxID=2496640 RepID=UPI0013F3CF1F|nr:glycosyltransferase family 2 protein [Roseococcus sp. SYP-B2431]
MADADPRPGAALPIVAIIVSYGRRADLARCLASLGRQSPALEGVIVVDNGSTDGTVEMVRRDFPWVRLVAAPENLGPCVARNLAALMTEAPFLWFLDSDTELRPADGAARMHALFAAPEVGAVGGEALLGPGDEIVGVKRMLMRPNGVVQGDSIFAGVADCEVIASCNLMMRRPAFLAAGGFDPFYFFFYEDMDVTWRVGRQGFRQLVLAPMPVVHHFSERMRVKRLWLEARNRMYFCVKNMGLRSVLRMPLNDLAFLLDPDNLRRLFRRAAKSGGAKSLIQVAGAAPAGGGGKLRRAALLAFAMGARMVMTYLALPLVIGPALRARRRPPLDVSALPPHLRGLAKPEAAA